jgi:CheY-like chemotaxis protein
MHGGGVMLHSSVGVGSRFTVTLPMIAQIADHEVGDDEREPSSAPLILVAGGEQRSAAYLARGLLSAGYRCVIVDAGMAALERVRADTPAAVIINRRIAELGGLEYLRRLRSDPALARVPTIMIGATTVMGDAERALAVGAQVYMSRPISMPKLLDTLAEVIGSSNAPA